MYKVSYIWIHTSWCFQWISTRTICLHCSPWQGLGERGALCKVFSIELLGEAGGTTIATAGKELTNEDEDWWEDNPPNAVGNGLLFRALLIPPLPIASNGLPLSRLLPPSRRGSSDNGLKWKSKFLKEKEKYCSSTFHNCSSFWTNLPQTCDQF